MATINESIIEQAHADGVEVILTCDNGISAFHQVELAKKLYRDAVCRLRLTLQKYHIAHIIDVRRARLALKTRYCACDLWDFLDGREGVKFGGEYLRPYEWSTERENGLCALAASLPTESALSPTDAP